MGELKVNESRNRLFYFLRCMLCFSAISLGIMDCRSLPTPEQAQRVVTGLDTVDAIIEASNITPEKKTEAHQKTEAAKKLVTEQAVVIVKQTEQIATLSKYKHWVWAFLAGLGLAVAGGGFYLLKNRFLPV